MAVDLKGEDECGIIQRRITSSSTNDFVVFDNSSNSSNTSRRLDLTTREGRLQTFFDWPPSHPIQPLDLAEAGFYYSGRGDDVVCAFCRNGLKEFEADDDPWIEHAIWNPQCDYLIRKKGIAFVNQARLRKFRLHLNEITASSVPENIVETPISPSPPPPAHIDHGASAQVSSIALEDQSRHNNNTEVSLAFDQASLSSSTSSSSPSSSDSEISDEKLCIICCDKERSIVFLPCGHLSACANCAVVFTNCPNCRGQIEGLVRVYF